MKKFVYLMLFLLSFSAFAVNFNLENNNKIMKKIPSEEAQAFCYEYAVIAAGGSYEVFGAEYDACLG